ncbi:MAG: hypothetical protein JW809_07875 [Pirellulales bacterium]|nr:hypothetical protein [Pirellulales bacterium]
MRSYFGMLAAAGGLALALCAEPAWAFERAWNSPGGCSGCGSGQASYYGAPACGAPGYGSMVPGCCQCPPSRCDDAWEGYCEERGRCWGWWMCRRPAMSCGPVVMHVAPGCGVSSCGANAPSADPPAPTAAPAPSPVVLPAAPRSPAPVLGDPPDPPEPTS